MSSIHKAAVAAFLLVCCASFAFAPAQAAEGLAKGSNILSAQFTTGIADLATAENGTGYVTAYAHSEWGGQLQFQRLLSDDWALAVAFGVGTFKETDKPGDNAVFEAPQFEYKQSSWKTRIGADRFVHLTPTFHLFVGPGIEYWTGDQTRTTGTSELKSEKTTRWAFNGRMGAHIALGKSFGLEGHLGHYFGTASLTDHAAKAKWSPSGTESAVGLAFKF